MLTIEGVARFPRLGLVGLVVMVIGAALDIGLNLGGDAHGMHAGSDYRHNGHLVALAGMLLVMIGILRVPLARLVRPHRAARAASSSAARARTDQPSHSLRGLLSVALALAGGLHLALAPAHFAESALMGLGFLAAAATELGLAGLVLARPRREVYVATIVVATALIGFYAYNVMIGLPFSDVDPPNAAVSTELVPAHGAHPADPDQTQHGAGHEAATEAGSGHHAGGLRLGQGEAVDAGGALTKLAELAAIGLAVGLLRRRPH